MSNLLCRDETDAAIGVRLDTLITRLNQRDRTMILVTNEVGLGLVPDNELGRRFRDLSGTMNQRIATIADEVYFAAMGLVLQMKPSPLLRPSR
jgi:adenosylcobinamide kinase/adenosylcobinamide-phosphate guanylyltransferase